LEVGSWASDVGDTVVYTAPVAVLTFKVTENR